MNNLTIEQHIQHQLQLQAIMAWGMVIFAVVTFLFWLATEIEIRIKRGSK